MMKNNPIEAIAKECGAVLSEKKAEDVLILDLRNVNTYLDYFIICTATSKIHCRALAREAERYFSGKGIRRKGVDANDSDWVVLDYNEIVVHCFTEDMRKHYALEKLWSDARVLK